MKQPIRGPFGKPEHLVNPEVDQSRLAHALSTIGCGVSHIMSYYMIVEFSSITDLSSPIFDS